jgi:hypothetical protein
MNKTYLHSIDLANWYVCWNLSISGGRLSSCDITGIPHRKAGEHVEIRETSIEDLKNRKLPPSFLQPRLYGTIGNNDLWQMEIDFEEARRIYAPDAPSRLSALYLADNSQTGRRMLKETFPGRIILEVETKIILRSIKADMRWVEEYRKTHLKEILEKYWEGLPMGEEGPQWEYLIDGVIQMKDMKQLERIKLDGAKPPGYKKGNK